MNYSMSNGSDAPIASVITSNDLIEDGGAYEDVIRRQSTQSFSEAVPGRTGTSRASLTERFDEPN